MFINASCGGCSFSARLSAGNAPQRLGQLKFERTFSAMTTAQEVLRSQHIRVLESMKELARENEALKKRLASLERGGGGAAGASSSYEQLEAAHSAELLDQVEKTEELQKELAQLQQQQAGGRELQRVQGQRQMLQKACDDLKAQLRTQGAAAEQRLSDVRAGYETELAERAAETEAVRLRAAEAAETLDAERHRAAALRAEQRGSSEQKLGWAAAAAEGLQAELRAELRAAREALAAAESGAARQAQVSNPKLSPRPRPHLHLRPGPGPLLRPPPCLRPPPHPPPYARVAPPGQRLDEVTREVERQRADAQRAAAEAEESARVAAAAAAERAAAERAPSAQRRHEQALGQAAELRRRLELKLEAAEAEGRRHAALTTRGAG